MTKLISLLTLASLLGFACACSSLGIFQEDCGCSAYYQIPKDGGEIQVQFRIVHAEVVGGHRDCGFKDVPTRVAKATINNHEMREIKIKDNEYLYAAPASFDPSRDEVMIESAGSFYKSVPDSVKRHPDSVFFDLRR